MDACAMHGDRSQGEMLHAGGASDAAAGAGAEQEFMADVAFAAMTPKQRRQALAAQHWFEYGSDSEFDEEAFDEEYYEQQDKEMEEDLKYIMRHPVDMDALRRRVDVELKEFGMSA